MEIKDRVIKTFSNVFEVKESDIKTSDTKKSIDKWDSICHLHLIMNLEEEFDIRLNTEDVIKIDSVEKCINIINQLINDS